MTHPEERQLATSVLVLGKRAKADAHTTLAAGGINAALATMDPEDTWQQHAGVVRDETSLPAGLSEVDELEVRMAKVGVHPDLAGFQDLAHAFDLKSSVLAARATLEAALERRETRGCHNRPGYPELDPALRVNLVWAGPGRVEREEIPVVPSEIAGLMREVATEGKLVE